MAVFAWREDRSLNPHSLRGTDGGTAVLGKQRPSGEPENGSSEGIALGTHSPSRWRIFLRTLSTQSPEYP